MQIPIDRPPQISLNPFEKTVLEVYNRCGCSAVETAKTLRIPSHEVKNIIAEIRAKGHDNLIGGTDMARGQRTPPEVIEKIRELHKSGKTNVEIVKIMDMPPTTVRQVVEKMTAPAEQTPEPQESVSDVQVNMEKMITNHCRCEDILNKEILTALPFAPTAEATLPPDKIGFRIENALVMLLQASVKIPETLAVPKECVEITALHASTDIYNEAYIELTISGTQYCLRFYESGKVEDPA